MCNRISIPPSSSDTSALEVPRFQRKLRKGLLERDLRLTLDAEALAVLAERSLGVAECLLVLVLGVVSVPALSGVFLSFDCIFNGTH